LNHRCSYVRVGALKAIKALVLTKQILVSTALRIVELFRADENSFVRVEALKVIRVLVEASQLYASTAIRKALLFKDDKNSDKTWSLCNNEWSFVTQTKGIKNSCLEQIPSNNNQSIPQQSQQNSTNSTNITNNQQTQVITQKAIAVNNSLDKTNPIANNTQTNSNIQQINSNIQQTNEESIIRLNGKSIKNEGKTFFSSQERTRLWTVYLFTFICLIIIIWLLVKD